MSTITAAIIATIAYWVLNDVDYLLGWQALTRPIVVAPIIGLLLGQPVTGVVMGASLEAIFMGISAIGGSIPADPFSATIIAVTYTILTGSKIQTGLAIALPIGTIMASISSLCLSFWSVLAPYWEKLAVSNKPKKFTLQTMLFWNLIQPLPSVIVLFFGLAFGVTGLQHAMNSMPAFVMTGMSAAASMMVGVGFAILMSMIWSGKVGCFFFVGFILAKILNMSSLSIAILGIAIATTMFIYDKKIIDLKNSLSAQQTASKEEEEAFF